MTTPHEDNLEMQLAALTKWEGEDPQLWRAALAGTESSAEKDSGKAGVVHGASSRRGIGADLRRRARMVMDRRIPTRLAAVLALGVIGVVIAAVMMPTMDARRERPAASVAMAPAEAYQKQEGRDLSFDRSGSAGEWESKPGDPAIMGRKLETTPAAEEPAPPPEALRAEAASRDDQTQVQAGIPMTRLPTPATQPGAPAASAARLDAAAARSVIRKATIELRSADVRGTFLKASNVASEARGEYMSDSSLTGEGSSMHATLTLRVAAERLGEVLNALRELGKVEAEKADGEDVTNQIVDLEARLRNEQRVEAELLQLLEKRGDAPLKEILELRDKIGEIRGRIEQMTAQREKLGRLVSLATVIVIIRAENAKEGAAPIDNGLGSYFSKELKTSWNNGLRGLTDTVTGIVRVALAGAVWWILLIFAIAAVRRVWKSTAPGTLPARPAA